MRISISSASTSISPLTRFGFTVPCRTLAHASGDLHDELLAQLVGRREGLRRVGIAHDLHQAFAVAQVDENHAPVVAAAVHPAAERDRLAKMGAAYEAAVFATHRFRKS